MKYKNAYDKLGTAKQKNNVIYWYTSIHLNNFNELTVQNKLIWGFPQV